MNARTRALAALALTAGCTLFAFQNCATRVLESAKYSISGSSYCQANAASAVCLEGHVAGCQFNGQTVAEGASVTAYLTSTGACRTETRTCKNGILSGAYAYASCGAGAAAACLFNGKTIESGRAVTAYVASTGATSAECRSESRACTAGTLSGSFAFASCTVNPAAPASCLFNGQTVAHGASVNAFDQSTVPAGRSCDVRIRTCFNGALSGSGEFASCTPAAARSCVFNGQTLAPGQTVTAFAASTVPFGQACASQVRTCADGTLNGSGEFASCNPGQAAACVVNGQTLANGQSIQLYQAAQVFQGGTCTTETRTCANGTLSGSAVAPSCVVVKRTDYAPFNLAGGTTLDSGNLSLAMQTDGNLVMYRAGTPLWNSGTAGRSCAAGCQAAFQGDGNLVLYQNGSAYWASNTSNAGARLNLSSKPPYLSVRAADGRTLWGAASQLSWFTALPQARGFDGAADFQQLFSHPEQWPRAAGHVNVLKMYLWHFAAMSDQDLAQVIQFLEARDIALGIEFGPVTSQPGCGNQEGYIDAYPESSAAAISSKVRRLGGELAYIAMDEPLYFGHYPIDNTAGGGRSCRYGIPDLASNVGRSLAEFRTYFPAVQVGDIEPFFQLPTADWAADTAAWIDAFAAANGAPLAFFHDDALITTGSWTTMISTFQSILRQRGIAYGFMVNGSGFSTDGTWVTAAKARTQTYRALGLPTPEQIIVQTWNQWPRATLPETSGTSLTSVVNWYFEDPALNFGGPSSFYRMTSTSGGGWLYTALAAEVQNAGAYHLDGTAAYIYSRGDALPGLVPVRRLYRADINDHLYTCTDEVQAALSQGYVDEGIAGYALPAGDPRGLPFYTSVTARGTHFSSLDANEAASLGRAEGPRCATIPL